jgi:uncharacterized protein YjbI with pentapeptide repeats
LVGAYLDRADLRGKDLSYANLTGATLRGADLSDANLEGSILIRADLSRACLYRANLQGVIADAADFTMSYAKSTTFKDATMRYCSFRQANYKDCFFWNTDLWGSDFRNFFGLGTLFDGANLENVRNMHHALFFWWRHPEVDVGPVYEPREGWVRFNRSTIPGYSFQENAGMGRV